MMTLKRKDVHSALEKKGFHKTDRDHHYFTYHTTQGKKSHIFTKTSMGVKYKQLGDDLVKAMSKQCRLTMGEFRKLVKCDLDQDGYEKILVDGNHLTLDPPSQSN